MKHYKYIISTTILLALFACKREPADPHAGHSHDAKLQIAAYSDSYEVWMETDPLAVGHPSEVLVHFTRLEDFKPVEPLRVTLSLVVGSKGIRQSQEKPVSPGIYLFEIQPEVAGEGFFTFELQTADGTSQIRSQEVKVYSDFHEAQHSQEGLEKENPGAIVFTKEQSWKIDFATAMPVVREFGQLIRTTAKIQSSSGDETVVTARTSGIVLMEGNNIVEGKSVSAGQSLFTVSGAGMDDNNVGVRLVEAQNDYLKAEADYNRAQGLVQEKIISDKEYIQIKGNYENSKVVYENLRKNFSTNGQRVSSPISGYVKQLFVSNGQYAAAGQPLVSISQNKTLLLKADVSPKYAPLLPFVSSANICSMDRQTVYSLSELNGKFISYGRNLSEDNYLIPVIFQIDNKAGFISGGLVEIFIQTKAEKTLLTLPNSALTEEQGVFFVYVQLTPEQFEKREVKIGVTDGIYTEIVSGIQPEERVVTRGAVSVKLAQSAGTLDPHAGHVH